MSISVNKLFGLEGDRWMRHANPVSVWTRFAVLPLLALAMGAGSGSAGGQRHLRHPGRRPGRHGLRAGRADLLAVVSGLLITQTAKAWFLDRMVLLFEHMKAGNPTYAAWEY